MRIAVIILGLCLGIGVAAQSFLIASAASFTGNGGMSDASSSGIIAALLLVIGAAFAYSLPRASIGCFALAAFIAIQAGSTSQFHDLKIWGFVAAALGVLAYFADRELRAGKVKTQTEPEVPFGSGPSRRSSNGAETPTDGTGSRPLFGHFQQPPAAAFEPTLRKTGNAGRAATPPNSTQTPPVPAPATPPAAQASIIDQIERLATLKATGAIDDAEYHTLKSQVLGARQS